MNTSEVTVYSAGFCGWCERAKALLMHRAIAFREVRVDEDPALHQEMMVRSGGQRSVPQIFIGERHIGGFDELRALDQAGKLDDLRKPS